MDIKKQIEIDNGITFKEDIIDCSDLVEGIISITLEMTTLIKDNKELISL